MKIKERVKDPKKIILSSYTAFQAYVYIEKLKKVPFSTSQNAPNIAT